MKISKFVKIFSICTLIGLIIALLGIALGANRDAIFSGGNVSLKNNDKKLTTISKTYDTPFTSMDVNVADSEIQIIPSEKFGFEIDNVNNFSDFSECDVKNMCLTITETKKQNLNLGVQLGIFSITNGRYSSIVKIYLPKNSSFHSVNLFANLGSISAKDFNANSMEINSHYGSLSLDSLSAESSTVYTKYGSIYLDNLKSKTTNISTDAGSIKATNLNLIESNIHSNNGSLNISGDLKDNTTLSSNMGSINLTAVKPVDYYNLTFSSNLGVTNINGIDSNDFTKQINKPNAPKLKVTSNMGSINLDFKK